MDIELLHLICETIHRTQNKDGYFYVIIYIWSGPCTVRGSQDHQNLLLPLLKSPYQIWSVCMLLILLQYPPCKTNIIIRTEGSDKNEEKSSEWREKYTSVQQILSDLVSSVLYHQASGPLHFFSPIIFQVFFIHR